jgi:hypothetical protein
VVHGQGSGSAEIYRCTGAASLRLERTRVVHADENGGGRMLKKLIGAVVCAAALAAPAAAGAFPGPAPSSWQRCPGHPSGRTIALAVAHYPIQDLGGLSCREAGYEAGFVGFSRWHTGPGMSGPPYYQAPQRCRIIARHRWRGRRAHLWQCWNTYAHGPTSFRVDLIKTARVTLVRASAGV